MSAIATPAATPPRAAAPEGGRLKRKAKVPERFQSPPPAKRVRVQPPVRAKKPGNGEKHVEKHVAAKRADGSFVPSSRLFARRIDAIWRFSFSCFFFFVRDTPDGRRG